jgi:protein arginine kinase activator
MAEQESYGLCDECKAKEACYTVSVMMGDQVTQRRLCPDCMAKMNMNFSAGNVAKMISAIMGALTGQGEEKTPAAPQNEDDAESTVQCESCGTTLQQFVKGGKLGCPGCYAAFREKLLPMLQQLHGRVEHAGRKPLVSESDQKRRARHQELVRLMEQAVALEDFETAAQLRDRINDLAQEEDA